MNSNRQPSQRVLALDVGEKRVGIAISDPTGTLARPLMTMQRASREADLAALSTLVSEHDVATVVIGQPLSLDGTEGPQARRVARFAQALAVCLDVPVLAWDERFSTLVATEILRRNRGAAAHDRRGKTEVDAVAAAVILQSYLDSR